MLIDSTFCRSIIVALVEALWAGKANTYMEQGSVLLRANFYSL